ncbi:MAG TPA: TRAP transporter substrate-binding protein DctP [Gaiellaceae bacterium]|nr:TRAP transporter substrate-binding protein DctP [Gaiellaceae bacterium]
MTHARRPAAVAAAIVLAALVAGCGSGSATKAGKATGPVVLRMAIRDVDFAGDPAAGYFVKRVGQLSGGKLRIEVLPYFAGGASGTEQQIVRAVAGGTAELGAVGTRAFDSLGVTSFQALTAPMLIDSYPLERAVIASPIPGRLLDGVAKLGLTGLAVLGEGLRKPISTRALLAPADWRGVTFAIFRSRLAADSIRALGARPVALWGGALSGAFSAGQVRAAEQDLYTYVSANRQYQAPYATANVNLWPRTEVLLVRSARFAELTGEQQGWLRSAAADAAAGSTRMNDRDAKLAAFVCKTGGRLVDASPAQLAALRRALAPVYAALEEDPQTKAAIEQIGQLKRRTPPGPVLATCPGRAPAPPAPGSPQARSAVDGIYRFTVTAAQIWATGVTSRYAVAQNHGTFTIVLHDGRWRVHQRADVRLDYPDFSGTYSVIGGRITFVYAVPGAPPGAPPPATVRWKLGGGELRLTVVAERDPGIRVWFAHPWKKLG